MFNRSFPLSLVLCALGTAASNASADELTPTPVTVPKPASYALPFQLRPVTAATVVRSDNSF